MASKRSVKIELERKGFRTHRPRLLLRTFLTGVLIWTPYTLAIVELRHA